MCYYMQWLMQSEAFPIVFLKSLSMDQLQTFTNLSSTTILFVDPVRLF